MTARVAAKVRSPTRIPFTGAAKDVLKFAFRRALILGHNYIGTEHLLLGVLDEDGAGTQVLTTLGVSAERAEGWLVPELKRMAEAKAAS